MATNLPKDVKIWVDALRSGEYEQTRGTLQDQFGYCCLGVYAKVNQLDGYLGMGVTSEARHSSSKDEGNPFIYDIIRDRLGNRLVDAGVGMNDRGRPFSEIADMIEEYYNGQV